MSPFSLATRVYRTNIKSAGIVARRRGIKKAPQDWKNGEHRSFFYIYLVCFIYKCIIYFNTHLSVEYRQVFTMARYHVVGLRFWLAKPPTEIRSEAREQHSRTLNALGTLSFKSTFSWSLRRTSFIGFREQTQKISAGADDRRSGRGVVAQEMRNARSVFIANVEFDITWDTRPEPDGRVDSSIRCWSHIWRGICAIEVRTR